MDSILNQSFEQLEFIIVDDGSTDNSQKIILSYSDPRIRFYQNEKNLGITSSLNRAIDLATAEYIARMDADDICYPDRLKKQYEFIQAHPDGALYSCWALEVTEDRKPIKVERLNPAHYYYNITFACWIYHPTMVYSRMAVNSIGKYIERYSEDFDLTWRLSRKFKMYHLPEVLLEYRVSSESLWQVTKKMEYKEAHRKLVKRNISYFTGKEMDLADWQIDLISHNYDGEKVIGLNELLSCLKILEIITTQILVKENSNKHPSAILEAAKEKRDYLILSFLPKLDIYSGIKLILLTKSWSLVKIKFLGKLKKAFS